MYIKVEIVDVQLPKTVKVLACKIQPPESAFLLDCIVKTHRVFTGSSTNRVTFPVFYFEFEKYPDHLLFLFTASNKSEEIGQGTYLLTFTKPRFRKPIFPEELSGKTQAITINCKDRDRRTSSSGKNRVIWFTISEVKQIPPEPTTRRKRMKASYENQPQNVPSDRELSPYDDTADSIRLHRSSIYQHQSSIRSNIRQYQSSIRSSVDRRESTAMSVKHRESTVKRKESTAMSVRSAAEVTPPPHNSKSLLKRLSFKLLRRGSKSNFIGTNLISRASSVAFFATLVNEYMTAFVTFHSITTLRSELIHDDILTLACIGSLVDIKEDSLFYEGKGPIHTIPTLKPFVLKCSEEHGPVLELHVVKKGVEKPLFSASCPLFDLIPFKHYYWEYNRKWLPGLSGFNPAHSQGLQPNVAVSIVFWPSAATYQDYEGLEVYIGGFEANLLSETNIVVCCQLSKTRSQRRSGNEDFNIAVLHHSDSQMDSVPAYFFYPSFPHFNSGEDHQIVLTFYAATDADLWWHTDIMSSAIIDIPREVGQLLSSEEHQEGVRWEMEDDITHASDKFPAVKRIYGILRWKQKFMPFLSSADVARISERPTLDRATNSTSKTTVTKASQSVDDRSKGSLSILDDKSKASLDERSGITPPDEKSMASLKSVTSLPREERSKASVSKTSVSLDDKSSSKTQSFDDGKFKLIVSDNEDCEVDTAILSPSSGNTKIIVYHDRGGCMEEPKAPFDESKSETLSPNASAKKTLLQDTSDLSLGAMEETSPPYETLEENTMVQESTKSNAMGTIPSSANHEDMSTLKTEMTSSEEQDGNNMLRPVQIFEGSGDHADSRSKQGMLQTRKAHSLDQWVTRDEMSENDNALVRTRKASSLIEQGKIMRTSSLDEKISSLISCRKAAQQEGSFSKDASFLTLDDIKRLSSDDKNSNNSEVKSPVDVKKKKKFKWVHHIEQDPNTTETINTLLQDEQNTQLKETTHPPSSIELFSDDGEKLTDVAYEAKGEETRSSKERNAESKHDTEAEETNTPHKTSESTQEKEILPPDRSNKDIETPKSTQDKKIPPPDESNKDIETSESTQDKKIPPPDESNKDIETSESTQDKKIPPPDESNKDIETSESTQDKKIPPPDESNKDIETSESTQDKKIPPPDESNKDIETSENTQDKKILPPDESNKDILNSESTQKKNLDTPDKDPQTSESMPDNSLVPPADKQAVPDVRDNTGDKCEKNVSPDIKDASGLAPSTDDTSEINLPNTDKPESIMSINLLEGKKEYSEISENGDEGQKKDSKGELVPSSDEREIVLSHKDKGEEYSPAPLGGVSNAERNIIITISDHKDEQNSPPPINEQSSPSKELSCSVKEIKKTKGDKVDAWTCSNEVPSPKTILSTDKSDSSPTLGADSKANLTMDEEPYFPYYNKKGARPLIQDEDSSLGTDSKSTLTESDFSYLERRIRKGNQRRVRIDSYTVRPQSPDRRDIQCKTAFPSLQDKESGHQRVKLEREHHGDRQQRSNSESQVRAPLKRSKRSRATLPLCKKNQSRIDSSCATTTVKSESNTNLEEEMKKIGLHLLNVTSESTARKTNSELGAWSPQMDVEELQFCDSEGLVVNKNRRKVMLCYLDVAKFAEKMTFAPPKWIQKCQAQKSNPSPFPQLVPEKPNGEFIEKVISKLRQCKCQRNPLKVISSNVNGHFVISGGRITGKKTILIREIPRMSCNYCKRIRSSGVSTFMVRRGGGWVHLDHFLQEYDPCRMHMTAEPFSRRTILTSARYTRYT